MKLLSYFSYLIIYNFSKPRFFRNNYFYLVYILTTNFNKNKLSKTNTKSFGKFNHCSSIKIVNWLMVTIRDQICAIILHLLDGIPSEITIWRCENKRYCIFIICFKTQCSYNLIWKQQLQPKSSYWRPLPKNLVRSNLNIRRNYTLLICSWKIFCLSVVEKMTLYPLEINLVCLSLSTSVKNMGKFVFLLHFYVSLLSKI